MLKIIYKALKSIKELGLSYNSIHTWTNGCVFFHGALKDSRVCLKCNTNRFVEESSYDPQKVFWLFPLIPRLLHMYKCKTLAQTWSKHKWPNSKCAKFEDLEAHKWKVAKNFHWSIKYHIMVGIKWGEPIWRFEFFPFYMAIFSTQL
jgi:hypothetical protein